MERIIIQPVTKQIPYLPIYQIFERFQQEKYVAFLDSSLQNEKGRYSILGINPYLILENRECLYVNGVKTTETFSTYVQRYLLENHVENPTSLPLVSGAIGYFSYDYGRKQMGIASKHKDTLQIPNACLIFYDTWIIEDHQNTELFLVANGMLISASETLSQLEQTIHEIRHTPRNQAKKSERAIQILYPFPKNQYIQAIERMLKYMEDGDIYVANLTQPIQIRTNKQPEQVFASLRKVNPSPFGGYFNYNDFQIVSASPERFLQVKNQRIETSPIKGTRKRGRTVAEDKENCEELKASKKDKSELLMVVDMERNDLNQVCCPGTVQVPRQFDVETYATVFHLVSDVVGELREGTTVIDVLQKAFPGGSITGAPKKRAMEIIDELEIGQRGIYTGSMGYISLDGNCDLNIVIRTLLHKDGVYYLGVGGGITYESDHQFEYEEALQKARALLDALEE